MARKLLFAVDFSPYTEKLLGCAGELAVLGMKEVLLLHVLKSRDYVDFGDEKNPGHVAEKKEGEALLTRLAGSLSEAGLEVTPVMRSGSPPDVITAVAGEEDAYLIFIGAHGKGFLDRALLGSVSEAVLKKADRPVLVQHCRRIAGEGGYTCENVCESLFGNVLVATDFSEYSEHVKPLLLDLAKSACAPVTLLHVHEEKARGGWSVVEEADAVDVVVDYEKLRRLEGELAGHCKSVRSEVVRGSPADAILGYAERIDATLIVVGAFGERGVISGLLGSVAGKVARNNDRPVLVLKDSSG